MAQPDINLAERSGNLIESHKNYDPRIVFFYFVLAALLGTLVVGLGNQQLTKVGDYAIAERQQNHRRVLFPGPRGNIYDRHGRPLVENKHRFAVLLHLDELRAELNRERIRIRNNYRNAGDVDVPSYAQLQQIARVSLVQRYLDEVNRILGRTEKVDADDLRAHFTRRLLLPYTLIDNLEPGEFARLVERLPVRSPLEVYAFSVRSYPYGSAAAHTLGYVRPNNDVEAGDLPGEGLTTFKMPGTSGENGLEKTFDSLLQGEAGGRIYRVDPAGYKINPPVEVRMPKQGRHLVSSIDIDLQLAAEEMIGDQRGAAVAIEVATGEVLAIASKPDYDLNKFSPRATTAMVAEMNERGAWVNRAMNGFYPPGSTFKILTTIAGLRAGVITPDAPIVECNGWFRVGNRPYPCDVGHGRHGNVLLRDAIAHSCDIYYYKAGELMTPAVLAAEGVRFHLDQPTGIELPNEGRRMIMPSPEWKQRVRDQKWVPGDTANMAIGQGDVLITPLQMACFTASVARGELFTKPTLVHRPAAAPPRQEPIGLTAAQRSALIEGMAGTITKGTGKVLSAPIHQVPGIALAGKTGTAQVKVAQNGKLGTINLAWFICFAPVDKPEIAVAVMIEGETIGEDFYGGANAGPVVSSILKKYFAKKSAPAAPPPVVTRLRTE